MPAKSKFDWEWIEKQYRAGDLSLRMIASEYERIYGVSLSEGTIRNRAKRHQWTRDLTEKVQARARDIALRADLRDYADEHTIIEEAGERLAKIVADHLAFASRLRTTAGKMLEDIEVGRTVLKKIDAEGVEIEIAIPLDPKEKAAFLASATSAGGKAVELERKALNMDTKDPDKGARQINIVMEIGEPEE